jgi:hypothetical protein
MAIDALEIRMARLEGSYEQINERLGAIEHRMGVFEHRMGTLEQRLGSGLGSLRSEMATRSELAEIRRQMNGQFFWLLTFVLGSILVPILRDFVR